MARLGDSFFVSAVTNSIDCVAVLDAEGRLLFMNEAGRRLLEVEDVALFEGRPWMALWPTQSRENLLVATASARGGTIRLQADRPARGRVLKSWEITIAPLHDAGGALAALLWTAREITDQVRAQQILARTTAVARSAGRIAGVGGWEYDCLTGEVVFCAELGEMLGAPSERPMLRETAGLLWTEADRDRFSEAMDASMASGERLEFEGLVQAKSGVRRIKVLAEPEMVAGGCRRVRGVSQDVTAWREAMDRLKASERQARAARAGASAGARAGEPKQRRAVGGRQG
ncbi:MAG: PAS domain-containing protein [Caulobacteraceae bacterium]|nr:PAS domain-containing protein [Caulobacteraceae bacterium]